MADSPDSNAQAWADQTAFVQDLLDAQPGMSAFCDVVRAESGHLADVCFRFVSESFCQFAGFSKADLVGQSIDAVFPVRERSGRTAWYNQVLTSSQPGSFDQPYEFSHQKGWVNVTAKPLREGLFITYRIINEPPTYFPDKQKEFLNQLLQTSPMGIMAYEAIRSPTAGNQPGPIVDFKSVFFNPAYEAIFGTSATAIQTQTFRQRFAPMIDDQLALRTNDLFDFYCRITEEGISFRREHYYPHLSKWLDVSGSKLGDGFLVILHDITNWKKAELDQRQQASLVQQVNRQLKRSNESLQQFAYIASHDLQEPLRKVQSFGNLLLERYAEPLGDGADLLVRMQGAAERMQTLIRDLLAYSRLSNQSDPFMAIDLNRLVNNILEDLETVISEKNAQITICNLPTVPGNGLQLRQLFQNLISNALKFNQPDRPPVVQVECQSVSDGQLPEGLQMIPGNDASVYWQIVLRDQGIGFDPAHRERIFGAFQRLHGRNSIYKGSGIGLALVKRVVENHGGVVEAHSQPGHGATFTLYLPAN